MSFSSNEPKTLVLVLARKSLTDGERQGGSVVETKLGNCFGSCSDFQKVLAPEPAPSKLLRLWGLAGRFTKIFKQLMFYVKKPCRHSWYLLTQLLTEKVETIFITFGKYSNLSYYLITHSKERSPKIMQIFMNYILIFLFR
jgi:hypothetical protein